MHLHGSGSTKVSRNAKQKTTYLVKINRWYLFIWSHGEQELERFLKNLEKFALNLSFIHEGSKNYIPFLDLKVKVMDGKLETDLNIKLTDRHQ